VITAGEHAQAVRGASSGTAGIGRREPGCLPEAGTSWRKSSWSGYSGNCLEVAGLDGGLIGVRDSKQNGLGAVLRFDHAAWSSFLAGVKNGDFSG